MAIGLPNLRNLVFDRESMGDLGSLGIDLSNLPTINPASIKRMPQTAPVTPPPLPSLELVERYNQIAPSTSVIEQAIQQALSGMNSPDFSNTGTAADARPPMLPMIESEVTPQTPPPKYLEPLPGESFSDFIQRQKEFFEQNPELAPPNPFSGEIIDPGPRTPPVRGTSVADVLPMVEPEVTPMDSDRDRAIAEAIASAITFGGDMPIQAADDPILTIDPVQAAVDTAVGNGQPTTDDTILDPANMEAGYKITGQDEGGFYIDKNGKKTYFPSTETTETTETEAPAQPDFMTQLQELIAQMQAEQTAAAEAQAAAAAAQQQQVAEMTQNYMVGQPAVGYNPYQSGQYQNNPYGSAGVPDMGGITSIPVPAAYTPYQPPGGTT